MLAVYSKQAATNNFSIAEFSIFGSKRIGVVTNPEQLTQPVIDPPTPYSYSFEKGMKQYEFSNHLGNVLSTFTDRKLPQDEFRYDPQPNGDYEYHPDGNFYYYVGAGNGNFIQSPYPDGFIDYYTAQITSATDYFPFGMQMPGRSFTGGEGYRWGFQGQEGDPELKGKGNSWNYKYRMHDPRIGWFFAVDPLFSEYPFYSPYAFSGNRVIDMIEIEGLQPGHTQYHAWTNTIPSLGTDVANQVFSRMGQTSLLGISVVFCGLGITYAAPVAAPYLIRGSLSLQSSYQRLNTATQMLAIRYPNAIPNTLEFTIGYLGIPSPGPFTPARTVFPSIAGTIVAIEYFSPGTLIKGIRETMDIISPPLDLSPPPRKLKSSNIYICLPPTIRFNV